MFALKFKNQAKTKKVLKFLKKNNISTDKFLRDDITPLPFARIYQDSDGEWHLLGQREYMKMKADVIIYTLSETQYVNFLDSFTPAMEYDANSTYSQELADAEAEARKDMIAAARTLLSKSQQDSKLTPLSINESNLLAVIRSHSAKKQFEDYGKPETLTAAEFDNLFNSLPPEFVAAIAQLPDVYDTPDSISTCVNIGLQDGIWMLQSTATDAIASDLAAPTVVSNTSSGLGILFGVGVSLAMGVGCGLLAKQIHERNAVAKFTAEQGRKPSHEELQLIQQDAKHLGYKVFASMTGWTLGAAIIQTAFDIIKLTNGFHPAGLVFNAVIAVVAGIGEALGTCIAYQRIEKIKFCAKYTNPAEAEVAWQQHTQTSGYKLNLVKISVCSFISGFAWNMIGCYVPTFGRKIVGVALRPIAAVLSTGLTNLLEFFITKRAAKNTIIEPQPRQALPAKASIFPKLFSLFQNRKSITAPVTAPISSL